MNTPPEVVAEPTPFERERWTEQFHPGDAAILAAAVAGQVDYFITGDRHFIDNERLAEEAGLRIATPAQFMELWTEGGERDERG